MGRPTDPNFVLPSTIRPELLPDLLGGVLLGLGRPPVHDQHGHDNCSSVGQTAELQFRHKFGDLQRGHLPNKPLFYHVLQ